MDKPASCELPRFTQPLTVKGDCITTKIRRKRLAAAKLLGEGKLTQGEIGKMVGLSRESVCKLHNSLKSTSSEDLDARLQHYRAEIERNLPSNRKAEVLEQVVSRVEKNPFAALKAIQYADQIQGYVRASDMDARAPIAQPLFSLPAGAIIRVDTGGQNPAPEAIDVTPELE
jgi:hypothetical protein